MPEYSIIRGILGILSIAIALTIWRKKIGYLLLFSFSMAIQGAFLVAPAVVDSVMWWKLIQAPFAFFRLGLVAAATLEVFAFMRAATYRAERVRLLAWSLAVGSVPIWAAWRWRPEDWYEWAMILRQYALIGICVAFMAAWLWVRWMRPIEVSKKIGEHGMLWGGSLVISAITSTMTKGGLFWIGLPWNGADGEWQLYGSVSLLIQCWICVGFLLNLLNWPTEGVDVSLGFRPCDPIRRSPIRIPRVSPPSGRRTLAAGREFRGHNLPTLNP